MAQLSSKDMYFYKKYKKRVEKRKKRSKLWRIWTSGASRAISIASIAAVGFGGVALLTWMTGCVPQAPTWGVSGCFLLIFVHQLNMAAKKIILGIDFD